MLDDEQSQAACAAAPYRSLHKHQWQQVQAPHHPQQQQHQQQQDPGDDALTPENVHVLLHSEFPRTHDLSRYLAEDDGAVGLGQPQPSENMMDLQDFQPQGHSKEVGPLQDDVPAWQMNGEWGADDYSSIIARADYDGEVTVPQGLPFHGGSLDGGGWTSGCGSRGSPLVQCSSLTLDIGSGDSSLGVQCDGWLSAEASQGMHTVPALPPALEQDCSPRTNQLVPTRSYGGRKGGSLIALAGESDHIPLTPDTFAVKTEFGSPRADPARTSYASTLFAAGASLSASTPFAQAGPPLTTTGRPSPFKGCRAGMGAAAAGQAAFDSQSFDDTFGGVHFAAEGHAEPAAVQRSLSGGRHGPGMAAALMMMPTAGAQPIVKMEQDAWPLLEEEVQTRSSSHGTTANTLDSGSGGSGDSCFTQQASKPRTVKQTDEELRASIAALQGRTCVTAGHWLPSGEEAAASRASCLERYREKKLRRLECPTIRYMKRKINADSRPRDKGRFVKAEDTHLFFQGLLPGQRRAATSARHSQH